MADYPTTYSITQGDPRWRVYAWTINDAPGVVTANNFISFFNPVGSGILHIGLSVIVASYASGVTAVPNSMIVWRTTSHSGGTDIASSRIQRFVTTWQDPATTVKINNPTTVPGVATADTLAAWPPVQSTGAGQSDSVTNPPPGAAFVIFPGQGVAWGTSAGDIDQRWNVTYTWAEMGIDSVEG